LLNKTLPDWRAFFLIFLSLGEVIEFIRHRC